MKWQHPPSCLDSAFEREAMKAGLVKNPVFKENVLSKEDCKVITADEARELMPDDDVEKEIEIICSKIKVAAVDGKYEIQYRHCEVGSENRRNIGGVIEKLRNLGFNVRLEIEHSYNSVYLYVSW